MSGATETLAKMCELIIDCPHFTPEWTASGYLVLRNQNIRDGRLDLSERSYTHREDFDRRTRRAKPQGGDIIITREAPMGEVCIVPEGLECCVGQRQVLLRPAHNVDHRYLFYALRSPYVRHQIFWNEGTGSTVSNVRIPVLKALKIPRMGPSEAAIGAVLGTLDDKIELNRRMNETLEETARAIFRDWFVDFGPTRAKMEGRAPYLAPDLWSLFPDRLDDDGKPEGWECVPLSSLVDVNPTEVLARGSNAPYLDMASVPTVGPNPAPYVLREFGSGTRFRNGDALLARITPCLENGKTAFVQGLPDGAVGWGSTEFIVLRSRPPVPKPFAYLVARDPVFRASAIRSMTGTSGRQRASNDAVSAYPLFRPAADSLWVGLGDIIDPLFKCMATNDGESQTLAATRDLLLPKLMSGEVRLKDVESLV